MNLHFVISEALVANLEQAEAERRLRLYVDDVNHVFGKNTSKRFDYEGFVSSPDPRTQCATGRIVVHVQHHPNDNAGGTVCRHEGNTFISNSCTNPRGLGWQRIWDRETLRPNGSGLWSYFAQLGTLIHELEHVFSAGFSEYYNLINLHDNTGIGPDATTGGVVLSFDEFWLQRKDWWRDPLLISNPFTHRAPLHHPDFGRMLQTYDDVMEWYQITDFSAAIIEKGSVQDVLPELNSIVVGAVVDHPYELAHGRILAWNVWTGKDEYTLIWDGHTRREGWARIQWDGWFSQNRQALLIKFFPDEPHFEPAFVWYTIFDAARDRLISNQRAPEIILRPKRRKPSWIEMIRSRMRRSNRLPA